MNWFRSQISPVCETLYLCFCALGLFAVFFACFDRVLIFELSCDDEHRNSIRLLIGRFRIEIPVMEGESVCVCACVFVQELVSVVHLVCVSVCTLCVRVCACLCACVQELTRVFHFVCVSVYTLCVCVSVCVCVQELGQKLREVCVCACLCMRARNSTCIA